MNQETIKAVDDHEAQLEQEKLDKERRIEREQVEQCFGLTGGELDNRPWEPFAPHSDSLTEKDFDWMVKWPFNQSSDRITFGYVYDGVPEWCARDFGCKGDWTPDGIEYRTIVRDCLFGVPPKTVIDRGRVWKRAAVLGPISGETQCPWTDVEDSERDGFEGEGPEALCDICENTREDGHGYIYIGDGWCEVVYKCIDPKCEYCDEYIHCGKTEQRFCSEQCEHDAAKGEVDID